MSERTDLLDFPDADELVAAGEVAPPTPEAVAAAKAALSRAAVVTPLRPRPRLARRRRLLVAAAAVAAIAAGAVAYPVLDVGGKPASTASAAEVFLNDMAALSEHAPATHAKYWKVRMEWTKMSPEVWSATLYGDRAGETWEVNAHGKVDKSPQNAAFWEVGRQRLTWADLDRLPTDPKLLTARFAKTDRNRFDQVTKVLATSPASPELRSALFRIIARTPGVTLKTGVKDSQGRPGTGITFTDKGQKPSYGYSVYWVIDPKTGRMLEERSLPGAEISGRVTYLEVGPANRIG